MPPTKRAREEEPVVQKRVRVSLNQIPSLPTEVLDVFMSGSGTICELGLGPNVTEVKRPRLNPLLPAKTAKIVAVACGGAHTLALDAEGALWSWGQNDTFALGRDTQEKPKEDSDSEENDLNPLESTPTKLDAPEGVKFVAIAASDSASAAIAENGELYVWGTFIDDGKKAFNGETKFQKRPLKLRGVPPVAAIAAGRDHFLVLTPSGQVYTFGVGTSYQLGFRPRSLRGSTGPSFLAGPQRLGLRQIVKVFAGDYNSYAIDVNGRVYSWGLNNFGQCGLPSPTGPNSFITRPTHAKLWDGKHVEQIAAGGHHSIWLLANGDVYSVGETNFHQLGIHSSKFPEEFTEREQDGTPSYVYMPQQITRALDLEGEEIDLPKMKFVASGTDHNIALSKETGGAFTWGFGAVYQLGHGKEAGSDGPEDEEIPKQIKNTATLGRNMVWAGAGGQFTVLASVHREEEQ